MGNKWTRSPGSLDQNEDQADGSQTHHHGGGNTIAQEVGRTLGHVLADIIHGAAQNRQDIALTVGFIAQPVAGGRNAQM